jgi:hypothetical protein
MIYYRRGCLELKLNMNSLIPFYINFIIFFMYFILVAFLTFSILFGL